MPRVPQVFAFGIKHHKRRVRLHQIRFGIKPRLSRTASSYHNGQKIPPVLSAVVADTDILRHDLICVTLFPPVSLIDCLRASPRGRTVFLPSPVIPPCGKINAGTQSIRSQKKEDSFYTVPANPDMAWVVHGIH